MKRPAVFLDRDGTINLDSGYVSSPRDLHILPAARRGLKRLARKGLPLFVVTNQSGLARGYFTHEDLEAIHRQMEDELGRDDIVLEEIAFCPHHPDEGCDCRKPSPKIVRQIAEANGIDLSRSFFIGDKVVDVLAGLNAGCRSILLAKPQDIDRLRRDPAWKEPDFISSDLDAASRLVVRVLREDEEHTF